MALPKNVQRVDAIAMGRARILTPMGEAWDTWFDGSGISSDFMAKRQQPVEQKREL